MRLSFTLEQFLDVFRSYNDAVWPAQWILYALAAAAVVLACRHRAGDGRPINAILALLWLWMALAYHVAFFSKINPLALVFAVAFAGQAALFARLAFGRRTVAYRPRATVPGIAGTIFILYGGVAYPVLGYLLGHRYPAAPTFGVPCPTTIFTLGLLLWSDEALPRRAVVVPVLWAVIATSAATMLGMTEDFGLTVAALVASPLIFVGRRQHRGRAVSRARGDMVERLGAATSTPLRNRAAVTRDA